MLKIQNSTKKSNVSRILIVLLIIGVIGLIFNKLEKPSTSSDKNDVIQEVSQLSFQYHIKKNPKNTTYNFYGKQPYLEIKNYSIPLDCANRILKSMGLQPVTSSGLNIEHHYFQNTRVGAGRLYRTEYRWDDYSDGPLTFVRESYGCKDDGKQYDCLKKIIIGPTSFDDRK